MGSDSVRVLTALTGERRRRVRFFQVNQRSTFEREFRSGYLCCPDGPYGGWPCMKTLQVGYIIFHYNSMWQAVLGISRVIAVGKHKGATAHSAAQLPGTQCISYQGTHLSEDDFASHERLRYRKYAKCLEVHTIPCIERKLPKLLRRVPQVYLVPVSDREALKFLSENKISLDELQAIKA